MFGKNLTVVTNVTIVRLNPDYTPRYRVSKQTPLHSCVLEKLTYGCAVQTLAIFTQT